MAVTLSFSPTTCCTVVVVALLLVVCVDEFVISVVFENGSSVGSTVSVLLLLCMASSLIFWFLACLLCLLVVFMVVAFVDKAVGDSSVVALIGIVAFVPLLLVVASDQVVLRGRRMVLAVFVTFGDNRVGRCSFVALIGIVPFVSFVTLFVIASEIPIVFLLLDNTSWVLLLALLDPVMDPLVVARTLVALTVRSVVVEDDDVFVFVVRLKFEWRWISVRFL